MNTKLTHCMKILFLLCFLFSSTELCLHAQQIVPLASSLLGRSTFVREDSNFLISFEANTPEPGRILLHWKVDSLAFTDYCILEHSQDGNSFEVLGAIKVNSRISEYEIADNAPFMGSNYYRIKFSGPSGQIFYSRIVMANQSTGTSFKFYPNPVDKMLIVQNDHSALLEIVSSTGNTLIDKEMQAGVTVLNVGSLQKGHYFLHVIDKATKTDRTFSLLKN